MATTATTGSPWNSILATRLLQTLDQVPMLSGFGGEGSLWTLDDTFIDNDILCMAARKTDRQQAIPWTGDEPDAVLDFFRRWHADTQAHYATA